MRLTGIVCIWFLHENKHKLLLLNRSILALWKALTIFRTPYISAELRGKRS